MNFDIISIKLFQASIADAKACEFCKKNRPTPTTTTTTPSPCESSSTCCPQQSPLQPAPLRPSLFDKPAPFPHIELPRLNLPKFPPLPTIPRFSPLTSCRQAPLPTFEERRTGCSLNVPESSCKLSPGLSCTSSLLSLLPEPDSCEYQQDPCPSDQIRHLRLDDVPRRPSLISSLIHSRLPLSNIRTPGAGCNEIN